MDLATSYRLTVPTTVNGKLASVCLVFALRDTIKAHFTDAFGGYEETPGVRGYRDKDGQLVEERVYTISAWGPKRDYFTIRNMAALVKSHLKKEIVAYQIDDEVFVER